MPLCEKEVYKLLCAINCDCNKVHPDLLKTQHDCTIMNSSTGWDSFMTIWTAIHSFVQCEIFMPLNIGVLLAFVDAHAR